MKYLFIHQNFPGQFRYAAMALARLPGNEVVGLGEASRVEGRRLPGVRLYGYRLAGGARETTHEYVRDFESAVVRGQHVHRALTQLLATGFVPDIVVAHPGWGEALFLRDLFPAARLIEYCEFYYSAEGADVGFDPEFPASLDDRLRVRIKNATQLVSLDAADACIAPTQWQKSRYPAAIQPKIAVAHEGIDCQTVRPDPQAGFEVAGRRLSAADEVLTYVARNLEPYRGFHVFMRSLPSILAARPQAQVLIVGGDEVSYGMRLAGGLTHREYFRQHLADRIDWSRVHFLGRLPYADYLRVLQVSTVHAYLTYPFVLSWSLLEAMAAGCAIVASDTAPVAEVIGDGENGRLLPFADLDAWAGSIVDALADRQRNLPLRAAARETVLQRFDLRTICLPRWLELLSAAPR